MINLGVASPKQAKASDLIQKCGYFSAGGSVSRQTPVIRKEERAPTHFVSNPLLVWEVSIYRYDELPFFLSNLVILSADSLALCTALNWNTG